jgi:hypothetical protein
MQGTRGKIHGHPRVEMLGVGGVASLLASPPRMSRRAAARDPAGVAGVLRC